MPRSAGVICALLLSACGVPGADPVGRSLRQQLSGDQPRVDLLARKLLTRDELPPEGFAYYCYLMFADRAQAGAEARRSAGAAYLRLLSDVRSVRDLPHLRPEYMALLMAPVRSSAAAARILGERDLDGFLESYDHDRAQLLLNRLRQTGHAVPSVAIIGSRVPLERLAQLDPKQVHLVDLTDARVGAAEKAILQLERDLVTQQEDLEDGREHVVLAAMRRFFELLGDALTDYDAVAPSPLP